MLVTSVSQVLTGIVFTGVQNSSRAANTAVNTGVIFGNP